MCLWRCALSALTVLGLMASSPATAQDYPNKPIQSVVPFATGGPSDVLSRLIAARLAEGLGKPVVVQNKAGAAGIIGSEFVARSPADGYTIMLVTNSTHAVNPSLFPNIPIDVVKDFAPITLLATNSLLLVVHPSLPVQSVSEFIAHAKRMSGKLSYASPSQGTSAHIAMEWLKLRAGLDIVHVPYRGSAPAKIDLIAGQVQVAFDNFPNILGDVRAGRLRALAQVGSTRDPRATDIPTMVELGMNDFVIEAWLGVMAPAGTPAAITERLGLEINRIMKLPDIAQRMTDLGLNAVGTTPAAFAARQKADVELWTRMVRMTGVKAE
jgi:tripartite-type tricarboxylate transporter receptor subunit TctC